MLRFRTSPSCLPSLWHVEIFWYLWVPTGAGALCVVWVEAALLAPSFAGVLMWEQLVLIQEPEALHACGNDIPGPSLSTPSAFVPRSLTQCRPRCLRLGRSSFFVVEQLGKSKSFEAL